MRFPVKPPFMMPEAVSQDLRPGPTRPYFDHAAYNFFMRHNGGPPGLSLHDFLDLFERAVVYETLLRTGGSQKQTADLLKLKKQTLNWKVKRKNIVITKTVTKAPE